MGGGDVFVGGRQPCFGRQSIFDAEDTASSQSRERGTDRSVRCCRTGDKSATVHVENATGLRATRNEPLPAHAIALHYSSRHAEGRKTTISARCSEDAAG